MDTNQKIFVSICAKIYNDSFSWDMIDRLVTGTEIYDFLMEDACHCFSENGSIIPGDHNLWYLGCNEKYGWLIVEGNVRSWDFGESSFDIVEEFVVELYSIGMFTKQQYLALMEKISEGRLIDNMYLIGDYLISKRDGTEWVKKPDAGKFRENIKRMTGDVEKYFQDEGYRFYKS
ncbi:hypothetical protein ACFL2S_12050 [Thermodesulfobacteriota bacterium]